MKTIRTILLLSLTLFLLGCTKTKKTADIEDIWKPVDYFDELLGEWEATINFLDTEYDITLILSYSIDENNNCIAGLIEDYEPLVDKICKGDKNLYDIAWEKLVDKFSGKYSIPEHWEQIKFSKGKYFTKVSYLYFYQENRNTKIIESIYLNQFGNKMKQSEDSFFVSEFEISSDIIFNKVENPKNRIIER
jgi:hypothetical protein